MKLCRFEAHRPDLLRIAFAALMLIALSAPGMAAEATITHEQLERAIKALDTLAPELLARSGVPGMAVAVVTAGDVLYQRGFGLRRRGLPDPIDTDTVFQLASLSKPIASTVIAGLVGDKRLGWDMPVASRLPGFRLSVPWVGDTVSIADLLSHRSGLPDHAGDLLEDLGYAREEILRRLRDLDLKPFRTNYDYTNFGFTAAALSAASAVDMEWAELAEQRLFDRVGMNRSSYRFIDYLNEPNHATLHAYVDDSYQALYQRDADAQAPAGGASASIQDAATWLRLQLGEGKLDGKPVIGADALLQTHLPQVVSRPAESPAARSGFYGLGWGVGYDDSGRVRLSHSGAFALGAGTTVTFYPGEQVGIVVLTNGAPYGLAEATTQSFFDLLFNDGKLARDWLDPYFERFTALWAEEREFIRDYSSPPTTPVPPRADTAYCGAYDNRYFGTLWVTAQSNGLTLWLGPRPTSFPLTHRDGDLFVFETTGENALGLSGAEFIVGLQGKAQEVILERYNENGNGIFKRAESFQTPPVALLAGKGGLDGCLRAKSGVHGSESP